MWLQSSVLKHSWQIWKFNSVIISPILSQALFLFVFSFLLINRAKWALFFDKTYSNSWVFLLEKSSNDWCLEEVIEDEIVTADNTGLYQMYTYCIRDVVTECSLVCRSSFSHRKFEFIVLI